MKQLAAFIGAVALVVAAVAVRSALDDDGTGDASGGGITVICATELAEACRALDGDVTVRVEEAHRTADAIGTAVLDEIDDDVWLTSRPWAETVADQRTRAGVEPTGDSSATVARSPVALVIWDDRATTLTDGPCKGELEWRCLGDAADRPWSEAGGASGWGRMKVGIATPTSASGIVVLGGTATGFFGSAEFATNDLGGELVGWLGALGAAPVTAGDDAVGRMLTRGPGEFSAVGTVEAEARRAADRDDVQVLYPAPVAVAELVAVPLGDDAGAVRIAEHGKLRAALAEQGWRVDGEETAPGVDLDLDLPDHDGLPAGPVLHALLARWHEVTG